MLKILYIAGALTSTSNMICTNRFIHNVEELAIVGKFDNMFPCDTFRAASMGRKCRVYCGKVGREGTVRGVEDYDAKSKRERGLSIDTLPGS